MPHVQTGPSQALLLELLKTLPRQLFSILKDGDSTVPLGKLCQGSITFLGKRCFLMFRGRESFVFSVIAHCLWFYHWPPLKRAWLCLPCTLPSVFVSIGKILPKASLCQAELFQQSQFFLMGEMFQSLNHLHASLLDSLPICSCLTCNEKSRTRHYSRWGLTWSAE